MLINNLDYLEAVREENGVQGGFQAVAISSMSASGFADTGTVSISGSSSGNASESTYYYRYGTSRGASASSYVSGNTSPYFY